MSPELLSGHLESDGRVRIKILGVLYRSLYHMVKLFCSFQAVTHYANHIIVYGTVYELIPQQINLKDVSPLLHHMVKIADLVV